DESRTALFSKTRATALLISAGLGGAVEGVEAGNGVLGAGKGLKTAAAPDAVVGSEEAAGFGDADCSVELAHDESRQTAATTTMPSLIILRGMTNLRTIGSKVVRK